MKKKKKHENVKRFRKKTDNQTEKVAKRKSYQVKKMNSDANLARYYEEIEFGPEFVCVCCHALMEIKSWSSLRIGKKKLAMLCLKIVAT